MFELLGALLDLFVVIPLRLFIEGCGAVVTLILSLVSCGGIFIAGGLFILLLILL